MTRTTGQRCPIPDPPDATLCVRPHFLLRVRKCSFFLRTPRTKKNCEKPEMTRCPTYARGADETGLRATDGTFQRRWSHSHWSG